MEAGDLATFLRKPSNRQRLTQADLCRISHDVSKGCAYLEEMHFVHRDIAARNCLVSSINPEHRKVRQRRGTLHKSHNFTLRLVTCVVLFSRLVC